MISCANLDRITASYGEADIIPIEGEDAMVRTDGRRYILHRQDGDYNVTGLGWGHGILYIGTEERGAIGIRYAHAPIVEAAAVPADDRNSLDYWMGVRP